MDIFGCRNCVKLVRCRYSQSVETREAANRPYNAEDNPTAKNAEAKNVNNGEIKKQEMGSYRHNPHGPQSTLL